MKIITQLSRKSFSFSICEYLGSTFLVIAAIAPIILFTEVLQANLAVAVVANAIAVGFVLFALIEIFGTINTAYFNPAVSFAMAFNKEISWNQAANYCIAQILGGVTGLIITHLMFFHDIPIVVIISSVSRTGGTYLAEVVGTFILVLCIFSLVHQKSNRVSLVVGLLVGGMLLATSSTMFANPQVTIARMFTYSTAGISLLDGLVFIIMQIIGAFAAVIVWKKYVEPYARKF